MTETTDRQGVRSVETGIALVKALAAAREPLGLTAAAAAAGLPPAKAHRYLVSLARSGMVEQDPSSGRYRLGAAAVEIGLAAIAGLDVMEFAEPEIAALRNALDETVLFAVWGNQGPVVVRWADSGRPVTTNIRTGSVMPIMSSATGRAFAAFLPEVRIRPLVMAEQVRNPRIAERWEAVLADTRKRGMSRVAGDLLPGVAAFGAPVFDHQGDVAAVVSVLGRQGEFDASWRGPNARALGEAAARLSKRLGYPAAA